MSPGRFKDMFEAVGIIAVVASLIFVAIEVRQARTVALSEYDAALIENRNQLRAQIAENADVWARGGKGEALTETEEIVFYQLVIAWNDIAYFDSERMIRMGEPELAEVVRGDFARFLHHNPGARETWLARSQDLASYRDRLRVARGSRPLRPWLGRGRSLGPYDSR